MQVISGACVDFVLFQLREEKARTTCLYFKKNNPTIGYFLNDSSQLVLIALQYFNAWPQNIARQQIVGWRLSDILVCQFLSYFISHHSPKTRISLSLGERTESSEHVPLTCSMAGEATEKHRFGPGRPLEPARVQDGFMGQLLGRSGCLV